MAAIRISRLMRSAADRRCLCEVRGASCRRRDEGGGSLILLPRAGRGGAYAASPPHPGVSLAVSVAFAVSEDSRVAYRHPGWGPRCVSRRGAKGGSSALK